MFLVMDNGTQFNSAEVEGFAEIYGIKINFSLVYHPQANGMAEATNKLIVGNFLRNLDERRGAWLEELPKVLWAQRSMKKRVMDETPFALVYGSKAVVQTEAGLPKITTLVAENVEENQRQLARNLDLLEEVRENAPIRKATYQHKARAFYDKREKLRHFIRGEWVMRRILEVMQKGKFSGKWEGPYEVKEILGKGMYKLINLSNEKDVPRTWNAMFLKKYYI